MVMAMAIIKMGLLLSPYFLSHISDGDVLSDFLMGENQLVLQWGWDRTKSRRLWAG